MSIWPDYCNSIISFFLNFAWENLWVNFLLLQNHCSCKLINTPCTFTWSSQSVGVYFLLFSIIVHNDFPFGCIVEDKHFFFIIFLNFSRNSWTKSRIDFLKRMFSRKNKSYGSSIIGIFRNFAHKRNFSCILDKSMSTSMPNCSIIIWVYPLPKIKSWVPHLLH